MSALSSRLLEYKGAGRAIIRDCNLPDPGPRDVTVRCLYSGISRGTESLVYHGQVPESEHERMRCPHMVGDFSFPIAYGYCCVGEVLEVGSQVDAARPGQRVFVLHPHQDVFRVDQAMCNILPDDLSSTRAVLAANMETALNAVWDSGIENVSDKANCAVIGAGVVGFLTAHAVKEITGQRAVLVDVDPGRAEIADHLGFEFALVSEIFDQSDRQLFDFIFHTSATGSGLQTAIDVAAFEATIIEMSWYGEKQLELSLGGAFHSQRLKLISSQVGTIAPGKRTSHSFSTRMQEALKLLGDEKLDHLLEPAIEFEELPNHLEDIFGTDGARLCQLVRYS